MIWFFSAKTVIEENAVSEAIDQAKARYNRIDDLYEGLKWRLARQPDDAHVPIPDVEGFHTIKTIRWLIEGVPVIQAVYRITDDEIIITSIRIIDPDEED